MDRKFSKFFLKSIASGLGSLLFPFLLPALLFAQSPQQGTTTDQNAPIAEAFNKIDRIQAELQQFEGNVETQGMLAKQLEEKSDRNYRDLEMRLQALETKIKLFQDVLNKSLAKISPQLAGEYKKFEEGLNLVQTGQYTPALAAFQQFLKQYPKSSQKNEARFWIAECRYALKDYAQAIKDYQKFVEANPKSEKAPQALLRQGDGFLQLQMAQEAKAFFKKLIQDYPASDEATLAKGKLAALENAATAPAVPAAPVVAPSTAQPAVPIAPATPDPSTPAAAAPIPATTQPANPASENKPNSEPSGGF